MAKISRITVYAMVLSIFCAPLLSFGQWAGSPVSRDVLPDQAITIKSHVDITCDFTTPNLAQDCIGRTLPALIYKASFYVAAQATMLLQVSYLKQPYNGKPSVSTGTSFLIDRKKGLFLTARHVLVSDKIWSTILPRNDFPDLESEIENHLQDKDNVVLKLTSETSGTSAEAQLVALDRNADLALIQVRSLAGLTMANYSALWKEIPFASSFDCGNDNVSAIGYSDPGNTGDFRQSSTTLSPALCDFSPRAYQVGERKYNFSLYSTESGFKPGYSGGPVLNQHWELVGVVSGAATGGQAKYFVPLSQVQSFLSRFR